MHSKPNRVPFEVTDVSESVLDEDLLKIALSPTLREHMHAVTGQAIRTGAQLRQVYLRLKLLGEREDFRGIAEAATAIRRILLAMDTVMVDCPLPSVSEAWNGLRGAIDRLVSECAAAPTKRDLGALTARFADLEGYYDRCTALNYEIAERNTDLARRIRDGEIHAPNLPSSDVAL
jgi:hypothetical protein